MDRVARLGYHEKGWPTFEYALAMMIKVANTSVSADWPQVLDLGKTGDAQFQLTRPAPAEPLAFFGGHGYGKKRYTNGADRDAIVAPKCAASPPIAQHHRPVLTPRASPLAGFARPRSSCWAG